MVEMKSRNESITTANMASENSFPEDLSDFVTVLNMLDVVNTLSTHFICKLCHSFMIDVCTFSCGHMFCKYCAISSLRSQPNCPVCQQEAYKPFASRCYEIDSVIDDFYPLLWNFYRNLGDNTRDGRELVKLISLARANPESYSIQKNMDNKVIQLHSPVDRDKLRQRRRLVSERRDILLQAPCTSILQKLGTLGWGTGTDEQNIHVGMQTLVWLALCYALWNLIYMFQHPFFDGGLRTFVYSVAFLTAFNILQKNLFVNPENAPDLLDFELWEWTEGEDNESNQYSGSPFSVRMSGYRDTLSSGVATSSSRSSSGGTKSSSGSFKDCSEDGEESQQSRLEMEQIMTWRQEGVLNLERMFKISSEMIDALGQVNTAEW